MNIKLSLFNRIQKICCNIPIIIIACFILSSFLMYVNNPHVVWFCTVINDYEIDLWGYTIEIWKRILLILIAGICFLPYIIVVTEKKSVFKDCRNENWVRLGLIWGISVLIVAVFAPAAEAIQSNNINAASISALQETATYNSAAQNRALLSCPQNILFPFMLCLILHFSEDRASGNICTIEFVIQIMIVSLGLYCLKWDSYSDSVLASILICGAAMAMNCITYLKNKSRRTTNLKNQEGKWKLLMFGLIVLGCYCSVIIEIVLALLGRYQRGGLFSDYDKFIIAAFTVIVIMFFIIYFKERRKHTSQIMALLPLILLIWIGFAINYILDASVIAFNTTENYFEYWLPWETHPDIWFFDPIGCLLYTLFFLYNKGLREKPHIITYTLFLVFVCSFVPCYEITGVTGITTISIVNILLGLLSPGLLIMFGIEGHKHKTIGG